MPITLPEPISHYFSTDRDANADIGDCFTADAVVKDEQCVYSGQDEIRQWKAEVSRKFSYLCEPFACEVNGATIIVTSKLTGSFPGSPVELRYLFGLEGDKIKHLEITP